MVIRRANSKDAATLSQLVLKSALMVRASDFTDEGWSLLKQTNSVAAVQARFESLKYFALICEVDGIAAGYIGMVDFEKIDHMFVLPEYQKKGIAAELWAEAQEICVASGNGDYYWVRSSTYAEPVYRAFGFSPSAERESSKGISSRFMEKGLNPLT